MYKYCKKNKQISKEVLSEVLKIDVKTLEEDLDSKYNSCLLIHYNAEDAEDGVLILNIYELISLCKKWALKNNYQMYSGIVSVISIEREDYYFCAIKTKAYSYNKYANSLPLHINQYKHIELDASEQEAVFKACDYIYKLKKEIK